MSIGIQTGIGLILLFGILVGSLALLIAFFKRNLLKVKKSCGLLLVCCSLFYGMTEYLSYEYQKNVTGLSFDKGINIVSFSCCYDHHGDGTDVNIYEGEVTNYSAINSVKLDALPSSSLNLNGYKYEQPWISVNIQEDINKEAIELARQALEYVDDGERKNAIKMFSALMVHKSSRYAYIYDGERSIDFWLVNAELAQYIDINHYN